MGESSRKKLTLSADPSVIRKAHELARRHGTSVSSMFERFVRYLAGGRERRGSLGPTARRASGLARLPKGKSSRQVLEDALLARHGLSR